LWRNNRVECTTDTVLLMNDDFGTHTHTHTHTQYDRKTIQIFLSRPTSGGINLHLKRNTKCETVAKIQHTQVAKLWSNDHV